MIDARYQFGALGAHEDTQGGVEFGFWLPGTISDYIGGGGRPLTTRTPTPAWRRRYHPIKQGLVQSYDVAFRFGRNETFPEVTRNSFRWAWDTLKCRSTLAVPPRGVWYAIGLGTLAWKRP